MRRAGNNLCDERHFLRLSTLIGSSAFAATVLEFFLFRFFWFWDPRFEEPQMCFMLPQLLSLLFQCVVSAVIGSVVVAFGLHLPIAIAAGSLHLVAAALVLVGVPLSVCVGVCSASDAGGAAGVFGATLEMLVHFAVWSLPTLLIAVILSAVALGQVDSSLELHRALLASTVLGSIELVVTAACNCCNISWGALFRSYVRCTPCQMCCFACCHK